MIILGVDTSLRSTGFAVVDFSGSRFTALEYGNIPNAQNVPHSECLRRINAGVSSLVAQYGPDVCSVEKVIYGKNANTMMILGEARGAVIVAASSSGVPIYEYEPRRVKMSVCGNGMASKEQVQRMVKVLFNLNEAPQNDAADALALAVCHANSKSTLFRGDNLV